MKRNMGIVDRTIRGVLAVIVGYLMCSGILTGTLSFAIGAAAVVFLIVGATGFCLLYALAGISTMEKIDVEKTGKNPESDQAL